MDSEIFSKLQILNGNISDITKEIEKIIKLNSDENVLNKNLIDEAIKENINLVKENDILNKKINELEKELDMIKKTTRVMEKTKNKDRKVGNENIDFKLETVKSINITTNNRFCESDNGTLIKKKVNLVTYSKEQNEISGSIKTKVFICRRCNKYFVDKNCIENIYSMIDYKNNNIKYEYQKELNKESLINILGYNTTLNRKSRIRIIKNIIVPVLGAKKMKNHLIFLVNLQVKNTKDFSNAISIWKSDIEFIEQNYNI